MQNHNVKLSQRDSIWCNIIQAFYKDVKEQQYQKYYYFTAILLKIVLCGWNKTWQLLLE